MAQRKPILIDGEVREVKTSAKLADVVMPEVQSVVTHGGMLIPRSEFTRVAAPEGFETNLSAINKGALEASRRSITDEGLTADVDAGSLYA